MNSVVILSIYRNCDFRTLIRLASTNKQFRQIFISFSSELLTQYHVPLHIACYFDINDKYFDIYIAHINNLKCKIHEPYKYYSMLTKTVCERLSFNMLHWLIKKDLLVFPVAIKSRNEHVLDILIDSYNESELTYYAYKYKNVYVTDRINIVLKRAAIGAIDGDHLFLIKQLSRYYSNYDFTSVCKYAITKNNNKIAKYLLSHNINFDKLLPAVAANMNYEITCLFAFKYKHKINMSKFFHSICMKMNKLYIEYAIKLGIGSWNTGLSIACSHNLQNLIEIMVGGGATTCLCGKSH